MISLKILSENRDNGQFKGEPGLSVFVEAFGNRFLIDCGLSELFLSNAKLLGVNVDDVEKVILTHGHNDHTGGVQFLNNKKTIIMHPLAYKERWSIRRGEFLGFSISRKDLHQNHNVFETKNPIEFCNDCFFLGEIPMVVKFERDGNFASTLDKGLTRLDYTEDDSGVAINTNKGLFVIAGCGHRGICNLIEHAKKITGQPKVYGVFGGFHFRDIEKQKEKIDYTIEYFKKNDIKEVFLGHCVVDEVIDYFEQNLSDIKINRLAAGKEYELDLQSHRASVK